MPNALRKRYRALRRSLSEAAQRDHAKAVSEAISSSKLMRAGAMLGCYLATDGELDLRPTMEACWCRRVATAIPLIDGKTLRFAVLDARTALEEGPFGIAQPRAPQLTEIGSLDAVLAPLVAFDDNGARLGMGAGYYDRAFADVERPLIIGIAHEIQLCSELEPEAWDVPLDALVSEAGWRIFSRRARSLTLY